MLAKILNGVVVEIIPDFDPVFPDIPVEERFSPEFLKDCVPCDETVQQRYTYSDGAFFEPVEPVEETTEGEEISEIAEETATEVEE